MDFEKLIFESKIQNRNSISGFEEQILHFFRSSEVPISHFPETEFLKNRNFKFWQSRILHFHPISTQNFQFLGSISQNFLRISLHTRKFCSPHFSSTYALPGNHHPANTYASSTPEAYSRGSRSSVRLNIKIINYRYLI